MAEGRSFYDRWPKLSEEEKRQIVELFLKRIVVGKDDVTVELLSLPSFGNVADGQRTGKGVLPICQVAFTALRPKPAGYPSAPKTLGEHLKRRRMDLGLIQREVSARVGVTEASVWNWENGLAEPEIRHLPAIFAFLGHDPRPKPQTIAERLMAFRTGKGWARPRLAAELRVDPSTLARWERGERTPWGQYADRVGELLGCQHAQITDVAKP
jgi:transcriptional regulator with XRE-family HTH domain